MEKTFGRQKRFDCIPKLIVSHHSIWINFGKVVLFRLFLKIFTDILLLLKREEVSTRRPFCTSILKVWSVHYCFTYFLCHKRCFITSDYFFLYWSMFIKNHSKNICKDMTQMMFFVIDRPFAKFLVKFVKKIIFVKFFVIPMFNIFWRKFLKVSFEELSISLWQSLKPVSKVVVWWKHLDLFVRGTPIKVPFVDLAQVMSVIKFFNENVLH